MIQAHEITKGSVVLFDNKITEVAGVGDNFIFRHNNSPVQLKELFPINLSSWSLTNEKEGYQMFYEGDLYLRDASESSFQVIYEFDNRILVGYDIRSNTVCVNPTNPILSRGLGSIEVQYLHEFQMLIYSLTKKRYLLKTKENLKESENLKYSLADKKIVFEKK